MNGTENDTASQLFDQLISAVTCKSILSTFHDLCDCLGLTNTDHRAFYKKLKSKLTSWKANSLWVKLDKRAAHRDYRKMEACPNTKVLIIGAGPCGLRMAIEVALMGAKAVVVEKRDRFSRNNVLHLWNFVIADLRNLGAKKFFGKFCAGSIEHISIRQLQCILLKVALLLGVEVHVNVAFEGLIEPPEDQSTSMGWRCKLSPSNHPVSEYQFDALIGADGKRNTVPGFQRKEFRGKLAIAITANFINRNTNAEARVEEISGVAFIFNQKFFLDLKRETQIDLENIVYYKDETHYFVMTAKKGSLLEKGVLKEDYSDTVQLLSRENVDQEALLNYAKEAANFSTNYQLPNLEYAVNHYGQADIAMFDFTSMFAAENACRAIERHGKRLFIGIVGDSLLEPFWPTGSGCARGFLGVFDAAWMIKSMASGKMTPLQVIAERESIYQLLSQTTPENLHKNHNQYSIDPNTRYPNLNLKNRLKPIQVKHLFDGPITDLLIEEAADAVPAKRARNTGPNLINNDLIDSYSLLRWCQRVLNNGRFRNVHVVDFAGSWRNGLAFCALIHAFRPTLIEFNLLMECDVAKNNQLAFDVAEKELGVPPVMTGEDMAKSQIPDKLTLVSYISQLYAIFRTEPLPTVCDANWEFCEKSGSYVFVRRTEEDDNPIGSSGNRPAESSNSKQKTKVKSLAASKASNSLGSTEDMSSESDRKTSKESSSSGGLHLSYEELPDWVKFVGSQQSESDSGATDSDGTAADGSITMWPEQNLDLSGASDSSEDEVYVPVSVKSLKRMYEGPRGYAVTPHHKRTLRQKSAIQKSDSVSDIHASSDVKADEDKSKIKNSEQVTEDIQIDEEQFKTLKPDVENFENVGELKTQTYFEDEFKTLTQEDVDKYEASSIAKNLAEIKPPEQDSTVPKFVEDGFMPMTQEDVEMAEADEESSDESFVQQDVIALTQMWKQMADKQAGLRPKGQFVSKRKNKESDKKKSAAPKKATDEGNNENFEKVSDDKSSSDEMTFNPRSKIEEQIDIAGESTFAEETVDPATETDNLAGKINHLVNKTNISEKSTDPAGKTDYLAREKTYHLKKQIYSKTEKTAKTITVEPVHACRKTPLYRYQDKQIKVLMLGFPKNNESSTDDLTPVETSLTKEPRTDQSIFCDQIKLGESGFEACNETIDFKVAKRKFQDLSNESKEMSPSKKLDRKSSLKWRQIPRFRSFIDILKDNHPDATSKMSLEQDQLAGGSQTVKDKKQHLKDDPVNIKRRVEASREQQGHPVYVEGNDKPGSVNLGETFSLLETSSSTDVDVPKQGVMSSAQGSTSKHRVPPNKNIYLSVPSDVNNNFADDSFDSSSNDEFYDARERLSPLRVTHDQLSSEEQEFEDSRYQSALDISISDTRLMEDADVFHTVQERVGTSPGTQLANRLQLVSVDEHSDLEDNHQTPLEDQRPTTDLPEVNISEA